MEIIVQAVKKEILKLEKLTRVEAKLNMLNVLNAHGTV